MRMDWNPDSRVSFKEDERVIEKLDEITENGMSRSAKLRELVRTEVEDHFENEEDAYLPEREQLSNAYQTLLDIAEERVDGGGLRVSKSQAVNNLFTNRTPKDAVMDQLIRPLKKRGFVDVDAGLHNVWIAVRPLTPPPESEGDCAVCNAESDDLTITTDGHPAGPNLVACLACANPNEVTAHGD
jgi:hypothetical protein